MNIFLQEIEAFQGGIPIDFVVVKVWLQNSGGGKAGARKLVS